MSEWQPIETAPKDRTILLWVPYDAWQVCAWDELHKEWVSTGGLSFDAVPTHWMPLPEPPAATQPLRTEGSPSATNAANTPLTPQQEVNDE
jgi:hypothetical protein